MKLKVTALERALQIAKEIEAKFPQVEAYQTAQFAQNLPDIKMFRSLAAGISLIGVIVGGLGAMNTMLMSVFERTREIGVLRALGWRRRRILRMILGESIILSLIASVVGLGLGVLLLEAITAVPALEGVVLVDISGNTVVTAFVLALGLGTLGGLYPAWRASNLSPIEALRYE